MIGISEHETQNFIKYYILSVLLKVKKNYNKLSVKLNYNKINNNE